MASALAVLAAFSNALSAIFQRIGVQNAPEDKAMSWSLIREALRHLIWFAGVALIFAGFVLQAVAFRFGRLSSVQPIVTTELLFMVLILGVWFRYELTWREWVGAAAAAGGLAAFLLIAAPGGGSFTPAPSDWIVVFVVVGAVVAATTALGFTGPRWFRAAMFGSAGALMFALSATLTKQFSTLVTAGWGHVFTNWDPYVLAVVGLLGLFLVQNAFHAGPITASQSALTIVDPLASVIIGIWLFHDHLNTSAWRLPFEFASICVVIAGVMVLSRSPLVADARDETASGEMLTRQPLRGEPVLG
jgi:drug/metabolite transporter (DMT)-like permease